MYQFPYLLFFTIGFIFELTAQTSLKSMNLDYGPYAVGYTYAQKIDSSRTYQIKNEFNNRYVFRPIPISIWYPSKSQPEQKPLTILNYLEVLKAEEEWQYLPNEFLLDWFSYLWNTPENRAHLPELCKATRNADPLDSTFPVVVYAPSYQASSIENFALFEYLASNGYVVISSPSRGTINRELSGGTTKDMETQSRDIEFLLKDIHNYSFIDPNQVALMGFSFGGLSNAITVMKHGDIKALVSLDGTERYNYSVLEDSPYFDLNRLNIPYVHFAQKIIPEQVMEEDNISEELNYKFQLYDSLKYSKIYRYRFHNLSHAQFSTYGILFSNRDLRQDKSDGEIMESYKILTDHVLSFLDSIFQNDPSARNYMNGSTSTTVSEKLVSLQIKEPETSQFNYKDFNDLAFKQNYNDLIPLYNSLKLKYPELQLEEWMLNTMGLRLSFDPEKTEQGIKVFELALYLYPESANLYDSLAEAYLYNNETNEAKIYFKKSLDLNPQNTNARNRLKQLE